MKKRFLLPGILLILPLLNATEKAGLPVPEPGNPIMSQRADPHIVLHSDGYYYATATVPEYNRIEIRRAKTIGGLILAEPKVIWRRHPSGPLSRHIWAPEIHFIDGKWFVYFSANSSDDPWSIRLWVLENTSPNPLEGDWVEGGMVATNMNSFTLDATTFEHKGRRYMVWAQYDPSTPKGSGTNLYIAEMKDPRTLTGRQVMLSRPEYPWERILHCVNEAPAVLIRNGRVFMTYSASGTNSNYCMGLLSASVDADLLDPKSWSKSPVPVFVSSEENGQYGPGHNGFTTTPDGKTDVLVYHARNYKEIKGDPLSDPNRHTRVQILNWKADGTPDFGVPIKDAPLPKELRD